VAVNSLLTVRPLKTLGEMTVARSRALGTLAQIGRGECPLPDTPGGPRRVAVAGKGTRPDQTSRRELSNAYEAGDPIPWGAHYCRPAPGPALRVGARNASLQTICQLRTAFGYVE
jgi:hypothetical protein